ncbi:DUF1273 family protein [Streptococcus suis]|nr:DUF1273 family protein [Streptococcus suis]
MTSKTVLIQGYRAHELGIFGQKDPRLAIIKEAIRKDLISLLEEGANWFIFTGQLGFEYWCLETLLDLKKEGYECQIATIFLFANHGENWQEHQQEKLCLFRQQDFVKVAYERYENPSQFREFNQFLLDKTDQAYVFYEPENETQLKYLYNLLLTKEAYTVKTLTFERLNEVAENFEKIE